MPGGWEDSTEQAAPDAHLDGCQEWRTELAAARAEWAAVEALRTSEIGVPVGVTDVAVAIVSLPGTLLQELHWPASCP